MTQVRDHLLTADEVAVEVHHSRQTVLRWARNGELPMHKIGRVWVISRGTLDQWQLARSVGLTVTRAS